MRLTMDEMSAKWKTEKVTNAIKSAELIHVEECFCHYCCTWILNENMWSFDWPADMSSHEMACLLCAPDKEGLRRLLSGGKKRSRYD
jgi:hypothetical protein